MNIYEKMNLCKLELQGMDIKKTGMNEYTNVSYFTLKDIQVPIFKLCEKHALYIHISFPEYAEMTIYNLDDIKEKLVFKSPFGGANLKGCHEVQNIGATETYQRRYLHIVAFDILEHDIIDSGVLLNFSDAVAYAEEILIINGCTNIDELSEVWKKLYAKLKNDKIGLAAITKAKDERKVELS